MKEKREYFCDYFFGCVFLLVDFLAVVLVVFLFFPVRDLVGFLVEIDLFLRSSVACSRVMVLGSRSVGILRLLGRGRPLPEAGLMAGPLM